MPRLSLLALTFFCVNVPVLGQNVIVEGTVTYTGPLPRAVPVPEALTERPLIERAEKTRGLKDAVVWIEGLKGQGKRPFQRVVMDQRGYFFLPHVLAIESGQEVEFFNSDNANHGVVASCSQPRNCFNVITPASQGHKHRFVACKDPVAIGCPLHTGMAAWVFVFDHPYFAVTDGEGRFRLPEIPPGKYRLHVRHPSGGMKQVKEVTFEARATPKLKLEFSKDDLRK